MNTERAAVYARISEDPRHVEAGVNRQREDCEALIASRGWEHAGTFTDNDVAVLRPGAQRPQYEALMAAVRRGEVTRVVAYGLSRLWRSRTERAAGIEMLKAHRVSVALVKGSDLDLSSAAGRMYAGVVGEFDTAESEIKAERVARAALQRAEEGRASGHVAFGWRRVRERAANGEVTAWHDEVDPEAAEIVREIVRRLLEREPLTVIARDLTDRGVPTPRAWLRRAGGEVDAPPGRWGTGTVRKIAMRPANIGRIVRSREIIGANGVRRLREDFGEALAPPLVDRVDHDRVVALLEDPARSTTTQGRSAGRVRPGARQHLLTYGIGACGVCGSHLRVIHRGGKAMYACDASTGCVGRRQEWVDALVEETVVALLETSDVASLLDDTDDEAARDARVQVEALRARMASAADLFADGEITREQLTRINTRLAPELERAERAAAPSAPTLPAQMLSELSGERARERWAELDVAQRRALLTLLGFSVTILPARGGPGFKPDSVIVERRT